MRPSVRVSPQRSRAALLQQVGLSVLGNNVVPQVTLDHPYHKQVIQLGIQSSNNDLSFDQ